MNAWRKNQHPSPRVCKKLASEIGRSERYVSYWFWKKRRVLSAKGASETSDEEDELAKGIKEEQQAPEKKVLQPKHEPENASFGKNDDCTTEQNLGEVAMSDDLDEVTLADLTISATSKKLNRKSLS